MNDCKYVHVVVIEDNKNVRTKVKFPVSTVIAVHKDENKAYASKDLWTEYGYTVRVALCPVI